MRHRLTDDQWECVKDLFPEPKKTGRPRTDCRQAFDGMMWILRTGTAWRDLPSEFGNWRTIYGLFDLWNSNGTIDLILMRLRGSCFEAEAVDEELWCVDGTVVRAHRSAAGGGKKGMQTNQLITP